MRGGRTNGSGGAVGPWRARRAKDVARAVREAFGASSSASTLTATGLVAALVAASWGASWLVGGAGRVVPHWYYFPVLIAALRFGHAGALVVALVSGVLAGPLTPQLVAEDLAQHPAEWLTRTAFFVGVGQVAALLIQPALPSLLTELQRRRAERSVRRALERDELAVWFQPVLSVSDRRIVGAEALLRWHHPQRGLLSPGAFLPMVEQTSAIHDVGDWVLRRACAEAAAWPDTRMWVGTNLSSAELDSAHLPHRVADAVDAAGLPPSRLCVEVTESALVVDFDGSAERLAALNRMGVKVAIDDFGTGYASLSYVHCFPAQALKIDRSFVAALGHESQGAAIVGGVNLMSRTLGMHTIAEGVETEQQAQQVRELGCDMSQGFYHHYPMPAPQLAALLHAQPPSPSADEASRHQWLVSEEED